MGSNNGFDSSKRITSLDGLVVSGKVMGDIIGVTDRQIRNLAKEGVIPKLKNGSYELVPAIHAYIENIKIKAEIDKAEIKDTENYNKEKTLHERAKRQKAELILGQMKGEFHSSTKVKSVMSDMLMNFKSKMISFPTKVAPLLTGRTEISVIEDILRGEVYEALTELSEYNPEDFVEENYIPEEEGVTDG